MVKVEFSTLQEHVAADLGRDVDLCPVERRSGPTAERGAM